MASVDCCVVTTILSRLYARVSSLEVTVADLGECADLVLCGDPKKWRETARNTIVAWNKVQLYRDSVGIFKRDFYQPPSTRGNGGGTPTTLEKVIRSAKQVSGVIKCGVCVCMDY